MVANLHAVVDTAAIRKARGAFFTPSSVAEFIVEWAVRDARDAVLEPSCGEAAFLVPAVARLADLGRAPGGPGVAPPVHGVDIHRASAHRAELLVREAGGDPSIEVSDFFQVSPEPLYDAVIGNPPYIRYQDFSGAARARSREAALRAGVPISGLASSWAAFTVHSALFLRKGGRLGLVVPAELLSVNYAAEIRRFLFERFARLTLVMFNERVFPDAQEDVVLVLAEGYGEGSTDHAIIHQVKNAAGLGDLAAATTWRPARAEDKWTPSLMSTDALATYGGLLAGHDFTRLEEWGDTTLGMVTGGNRYFALSPQRAMDLGLRRSDTIKLSPPGSSHLRGLIFTDAALREMGARGSASLLFRPAREPSAAAWAYIHHGEVTGAADAYKCRVRTPWWRVPLVRPAHLFLTYMNADTPRITTNAARAHHLNSVHGIYLKPVHITVGQRLLPLASLNSMTMVGAEAVGRAYGGGVLKIEPREADRLPVPSPEVVASASESLESIRPLVAGRLRSGRLAEAARLVDDALLIGELGMRRGEVRILSDEYARLSARRGARSARAVT